MRGRILIVDDNEKAAQGLVRLFAKFLLDARTVATAQDAFREIVLGRFDVAIVDWILPDRNGHAVLDFLRRHAPETSRIVYSAYPNFNAESAVAADQFVEKDGDIDRIRVAVERGLDAARRPPMGDPPDTTWDWFAQWILERVESPPNWSGHVGLIAPPTTVPDCVLDWLARQGRLNHPIVRRLDLEPGMTLDTFRERLFGRAILHGVSEPNVIRGLLDHPAGVTLVVRNVDQMAPDFETLLIEAIQSQTIHRIDSDRGIAASIRLVVQTFNEARNNPAINWCRFPDIGPALSELPRLVERASHGRHTLGSSAVEILQRSAEAIDWRQLEFTLRRVSELPGAGELQIEDLALSPWEATLRRDALPTLDEARDAAEIIYLLRVLDSTGGNVSKAAEIAGVGRQAFYAALKKHGIDSPADRARKGA